MAVAHAEPALVGPGDLVTFRHDGSYAPDPLQGITVYRWNFVDAPEDDTNGDGTVTPDEMVWEFVTVDREARPTFSYDPDIDFGEEAVFTITLQVEDALGRKAIDQESATVRVSLINHPPVARAHPDGDRPYAAPRGGTVRLDASTSYDPDSDDAPAPGAEADRITSIRWDLDSDGTFETEGATVDFAVPGTWALGDVRVVQVEVCDDGRWTGETDADCGGDCTQCRQASARLVVTPVAFDVPVTDAEVDEGGEAAVQAAAIDPYFTNPTYVWTCGAPLDVNGAGAQVTVDASAANGPAEGAAVGCELVVASGEFRSHSAFTVTVRNAPPSISAVDVAPSSEGQAAVVTVTAQDPGGDAIVYDVDCDDDGQVEFEGLAAGTAA